MTQQWWLEFFDNDFVDAFAQQDAHIAPGVECIERVLNLAPGQAVLDQCCGFGRMAIPLARKGYRVHGVDAMASYVAQAQQSIKDSRAEATFEQGDALEWSKPGHFDAAYNWGTSFGYLSKDGSNLRMLQRAFDSLREGGRFALEYYSVPKLLGTFVGQSSYTISTPTGGLTVTRVASIDWTAGVLRQLWTYERPGTAVKRREGITRMYMPHELVALFEFAGFYKVELTTISGAAFGANDDRVVIVGTKPRGLAQ